MPEGELHINPMRKATMRADAFMLVGTYLKLLESHDTQKMANFLQAEQERLELSDYELQEYKRLLDKEVRHIKSQRENQAKRTLPK